MATRRNLVSIWFLCLLGDFILMNSRAFAQTCGDSTFLDGTTNQCECLEQQPEDPNVIYLGGIFDLTSYDWGPDVFEVTVNLINQGWFADIQLPQGQSLTYDLRNAACDESTAIREYWDLRMMNAKSPPHALVGCRCSGPSIQLAHLAGLEGVPQVSFASNAAQLSDDDEFPYFSRLVAPNDETGEVGALIALLREFGWDRITTLATDTEFSKDLVNELRRLWIGPHDDSSGIWTGSVAYSDTIRLDAKTGLVDEESLVQSLSNVPTNDPATNSRIIFLAAHDQHAYRILEEAALRNFQPDTVWVGPSSWVGRSTADNDFTWLPPLPGYLGVAPFRNRNEKYQSFLSELQSWQTKQGKQVLSELPAFASELVDSIAAITMALLASGNRKDGATIVNNLRLSDFQGVSGRVQFTENGDRRNPRYSVFNAISGFVDGDISWTEVGSVGTGIGSATLEFDNVCFREFGCGLENVPEDTYPDEDENKLPIWVAAVIAVLAVLFLLIAIKYWLSRRSKKRIKEELEVFQKSIVGMRAALCDYVPDAGMQHGLGDVEEALDTSQATMKMSIAPSKTIQWCWKETEHFMHTHDSSKIFGDPADRWIRYDDDANTKLEQSYQKHQKEVNLVSGAYQVSVKKMLQTKVKTGFERDVLRAVETSDLQHKVVDLSGVKMGSKFPADLVGEPQMILVEGDIVQMSSQREDGWAFGTKLLHADAKLAQQLLVVAAGADDGSVVDDSNIFTDTGWFQLSSTRIPTSEDLATLQQTVGNVDTGSLDPPSNWDHIQDATVAQKHELKRGHPEYDAVAQSFMSTLAGKQITVKKVERIQNLAMYQSYVVKRSTICYRETGHDQTDDETQRKAIERFERSWLWHGSTAEVVGKIMNQGFNRSFCGKNATVYGKGVYFARDASYSAHTTYSVPDWAGNQYMLACRVCVGEYCKGKMDALTPDMRDPKSHSLYDSTVGLLRNDTMNNPSVYVTYHDAQAYPEYLITFCTSKSSSYA